MISTSNPSLRRLLNRKIGLVTLLCWLACIAPAAARDLRIAVQQGKSQVAVGSSTTAQILDGSGKQLGQLPALQGYFASPANGAITLADQQAWRLIVKPTDGGFVYIDDQWYRGTVSLIHTSKGVTAVNNVDLEDYLASVVGKEVYKDWPAEVLKAQAVAARSYALYKSQSSKSSFFDLGDSQTYQVYGGVNGEAPSTHAAVQATAGQVLTYGGKIINASFHASSGGHTENSENVWSGALPYLRGVEDFDQAAPKYQWTKTLTAMEAKQKLSGLGNIIAIKPLGKTFTGRITNVEVVGDRGSRTMTGREMRTALGLNSTLFEVTPQPGLVASQSGSTAPTGFQITGKGHGHGLGMSQWGALGLAKQGKTYDQILQHYYQGTALSKGES
ncbi:SpoIID/LytB domain-containing protein [Acaryochloris thomasi]|uniref:SpoIID/LytB domain-containing protein n=1 Tax=Acaryochloris thomasi TaxID=2929456 RepID=UPI000DA6890B|nr:SpoIID/LytB domain-containing protein [Acaryochloris thomasi]